MKLKIAFISAILIPFFGIKAQQPIIIAEDSLKIGKTVSPGLSVTIPEADYEKVLKAWIKDIESGTKSKVVTENNEMSLFGAKLKNISPNPLNVYSKLIRLDSLLKLYVSIETKKDEYIEMSGNQAEYIKVHDYLKEFSKNQYLEIAKAQSDAEEKKLRDLRKDLSSLENEEARLTKSIESEKNTILSEKDNITVKNEELNTLDETIRQQNSYLVTMKEGNEKKDKANQIKGFEKKKKEVLNSIESSETRIRKSNNAIDKTNIELPVNKQKQEILRQQIMQQEVVFQKYFDKYNKIKTY